MRSPRRLAKSFLSVCVAVVAAATAMAVQPVAAEIEGPPTNSWGVDGLLNGTQNDSLRSYVFAIEQIGNRIYVGGRFAQVTDGNAAVDRPYIAAFDARTGGWISSFTPDLNGSVNALQATPDGSRLFVGGDFSTVNGQSASRIVALDPTTGAVDSGFAGALTSATVVRDFDIEGPWLYVVGGFNGVVSPVGNNLTTRAARFDWQTGNHDPNWRPMVSGGTPWGVSASTADRVYLAGEFNVVGGNSVIGGYAAVTKTDATYVPPSEPFPINTTNTGRQYLNDVVVVNGYIFVGGSEHFVATLNESDQSLHRFHYSRPKGDFQDFEVVGDRVYAGCHCRADAVIDSSDDVIWFSPPPPGVQNGAVDITNDNTWITAFSTVTGEVDGSFNPPITAIRSGVWAIHGSPDGCLWAGGDITGSGGQAADNLVRLCDPGTIDPERPSTPGAPQEVALGVDSADLTWNPSTDNVGVAGYNIYDDADDQIVATSATNSATVTGLNGTNVFYARAFDAAGNVSWRSGKTTVASGTNSATVSGLAPGTLRLYTRAFDAAGNVSWRSGTTTIDFAGGGDNQRPSPPRGLMVVSVDVGSVELSWNASSDNVAVTGYDIHDNATGQIVATVASPATSVVGVTGSNTLYVKAFDAEGNTSWRSNTVTFTVD